LGSIQLANAQEVRLVGNKVETFINDNEQSSRLTELVSAALKDTPHTITKTTQAWSGSGLSNGSFEGYIDHYSLDDPKQNYLYSLPYVQLNLHVASTQEDAVSIFRLDQLNRQRVGLETRFANTDVVRSERSVSWARTQDFFTNIQQLAEQRLDYIVADKIMLEEMNKMLRGIGQEPLNISTKPIFVLNVSIGMRANYEGAQSFINTFNDGIGRLRNTSEYDVIYYPAESAGSILDAPVYEKILKRW
jgi:polar amino acid transport system substrate-binding protein